jgi:soluble lytic murein transglycosylase-like protein
MAVPRTRRLRCGHSYIAMKRMIFFLCVLWWTLCSGSDCFAYNNNREQSRGHDFLRGILVLPNGKKILIDLRKPFYVFDKKTNKIWFYNGNQKMNISLRDVEMKYNPIILQAAYMYNVNPSLIHSIIKNESGYNERAVSSAGALGLMQLMPGTARRMGVRNAFDPVENIFGGVRYLKSLLDLFQGNIQYAVAAYNAGEQNIFKYKGIPPFQETVLYVRRVLSDFYYE